MVIFWTKNAHADLTAIRQYIAKDSPINARKVVSAITQKAGTLSGLPKPGKKVPELNNEKVREVSASSWRIIFHVGQHRISIVTIIHKLNLLNVNELPA